MVDFKAPLSRIIIYAKDMDKMIEFYRRYFGFEPHKEEGDRITELRSLCGGSVIMLHQAGKAMKQGQNCVKLVFDVEDVDTFRNACIAKGLKFGVVHEANGYKFSNAKDPSKNSIQISSRAFK